MVRTPSSAEGSRLPPGIALRRVGHVELVEFCLLHSGDEGGVLAQDLFGGGAVWGFEYDGAEGPVPTPAGQYQDLFPSEPFEVLPVSVDNRAGLLVRGGEERTVKCRPDKANPGFHGWGGTYSARYCRSPVDVLKKTRIICPVVGSLKVSAVGS